MRRFARASQRFGSQVQCAHYPGSTPLITSARDSTRWRQLSSSSSPAFAERSYIPNHVHEHTSHGNAANFPAFLDSPSTGDVENETIGLPNDRQHVQALSRGAVKEFWAIVRDGQPDQVMSVLLNPRFDPIIATMTPSRFAEVFCLLSPTYFILPFRKIHRPLHPTTMHVHGYKRLEVIFEEFANNVMTVAETRLRTGHQLGLAEYTHLLRCASSMGDAVMAEHVWESMKADDIRPDVTCYNHLMASKSWNSTYTGRESYRLRITKHIYRKRGYEYPNPGWTGFGTKARSVRKDVTSILNEMIGEGFQADENTFIQVMVSSSRVGSITGIIRLLKAIWNVDVDALLDPENHPKLKPVTPFPRSSPCYPTKNLLHAVAHAFGTSSNMLAALRTIDHLSESYNIAVPEGVWLELTERAFVLSRQRFGPDLPGKDRGQLYFNFIFELYETMTSKPYNVRPTAHVHQMMAKTAWDQRNWPRYKEHMEGAYNVLAETRRKQRIARTKVMGYLTNSKTSQGPKNPRGQVNLSRFKSRPFANAVYEYDLLRLRAAQANMIVRRLARLLLIQKHWEIPGEPEYTWERRLLPQALEEWQDFLPDKIHYDTSGGTVNRKGFTNWRFRRFTGFYKIPIRRPTPTNGLKREVHPDDIDDDAFWANLLERRPYYKSKPGLQTEPLARLFSGVVERSTVSHPPPHDPFTYETLADCENYEDLKQFYREHDFTHKPARNLGEEIEKERESEDPADTAIKGFGFSDA
ncbi:uncharacterized protein KD926_003639 [Aspergillus affinis]|uniref:uncharacterized protein n=1 Tax=Aspergillus affinis TaxID=1070780 RepID=UPI0022FE91CA|nr:uncharacterized protein KD926_003639 [Aspergillus affinis]KAI9043488.1 hypothetical protein KD926_003639 [Aspergillus affinis]